MTEFEVDVIRKTIYTFYIEASDIDEAKEKVYSEYEKAVNNETLANHFYDENIEVE